MSIFCTFHRSEKAHFHCYECGSAFCENCISIRETSGYSGKEKEYFCPGCNIPAEMLSLGNLVEPFWHQLSSIFLYPFQLVPLVLTLILASLGTLFSESFLVTLFVWVVMVKYAYATLTWTAQGSLKAPKVSLALINEDVLQVFKQYVLYFIIAAMAAVVFTYTGTVGGFSFLVLVALALPAMIMVLVSSNSILQAINPVVSYGIISRIGGPYFLMYLFLFFILVAPSTLFAYLPLSIPVKAFIFLKLFFQQIYTIIAFHLMGYVLLQYHYELGYSVDYDFFMKHRGKAVKKKPNPKQELLTGIAVLVKSGKYQEAIDLVNPHIAGDDVDVEISEKFLQILQMAGKDDVTPKYALRHLDLLIAKDKNLKATTLYSEWQDHDDFSPVAKDVHQIAMWYAELKDFKKAIKTYVYFVNTFKKHELTPEVYFSLAQLLYERAKKSAKAKQIFRAMVKNYPNHPLTPEANEYIKLIG